MTDWGAVHNRNDQLVTEAVRTGLLDEADLDRAVMRVLQLVFRYHRKTPEQPLNFEAHHELARKAASRSAVLLKLDNALDALQRRYTPIRRAQEAAAGRVVLLFLGLPAADESEGYDRQHLLLPTDHMDLLHAVRRVANKVIVLLSNGAAVETAPGKPMPMRSWSRGCQARREVRPWHDWSPARTPPAAGWRKPSPRSWNSTPHNSISQVKQVKCAMRRGFR